MTAVLQFLLGIDVSWQDTGRLPRTRHVMVSNHQTAGDLMILYRLPQHYVHLISAKLPRRISKVGWASAAPLELSLSARHCTSHRHRHRR